MCCEAESRDYPAAVREMVATARERLRRADRLGADAWGSPMVGRPWHFAGADCVGELWNALRGGRGPTLDEVAEALLATVDPAQIPGLAWLTIRDGVPEWTASSLVVADAVTADVPILVTCEGRGCTVTVGGEEGYVQPGGRAFMETRIGPSALKTKILIDGSMHESPPLILRVRGARLRLRADRESRWSVLDSDGRAQFPEGAMRKWDSRVQGYFHADEAELEVIPGQFTIRAARGIEFVPYEAELQILEATGIDVELERRIDPHATGWYSADLHVHTNYGGEYAVSPAAAMEMQRAEGLDFMNLVAANQLTSHIHDVEVFRAVLDQPLPNASDGVTHMGIEYRNDLFGHFHVTGSRRDIGAYQSGHPDSDHPVDWPLNGTAAAEYRVHGATIGYCHPVAAPPDCVGEDVLELVMGHRGPTGPSARFAIVDSALGLAESLDVLSNEDHRAAGALYRRMVGAGLVVAVSAGSDAMLSRRLCGVYSNPPGWVRMYAQTGSGITLASLQAAIREGRTIGTNGPWLELDLDGHGPGGVLEAPGPKRSTATVRVWTDGPCLVRVFRGSQVAAHWDVGAGDASRGWVAQTELEFSESDAVTAEVLGGPDLLSMGENAYAHTSPVRVLIGGSGLARRDDVAWCLAWLDRLRVFVAQYGRGIEPHLLEVDDVISAAAARLTAPRGPDSDDR
jgi:hypothetical protein